MSVYVDDIREYRHTRLRYKHWCHMFADTTEELEAMARHLNLRPEWIQRPGTPMEHYDLTPTKRERAIRAGAVEMTWREAGAFIASKREEAA